jgi:tetratricopeptide (TPR) repeat protein
MTRTEAAARLPATGVPLLLAGLCALAALAVYWPGQENGFVWDDLSYLVHSPAYRDPTQWKEALFAPPTGEAVFRPLTLFSFAAQLWAGQTGPAPFHVANFLIHAVNVFLVTLLAHRMVGRMSPAGVGAASALVCGLIYGLHPALTESVLGIAAGRFDLMMSLFLLLALLLDHALPAASWSRSLGVSLLFFVALLCKETAVGFLLALPLMHLAADREPGPLRLAAATRVLASRRRVYAGLLLALGAYLLLRLAVLGPSLGMDRVISRYDSIGSPVERVSIVVASLAHYLVETVWIAGDLAPNRALPLPVDGLSAFLAAVTVAGVVILAWGASYFTAAGRAPGTLTLAFVAALVPVSNIVPAPTYADELQIASRYLTFPMVFACLALATLPPMLAVRHARAVKLFWLAAGVWIIASGAIIRNTIPLWKDEGAFFRWAIARSGPTSWRYLYINLGGHYLKSGDLSSARDAFMRAAELQQKSAGLASIAWYNVGNAEAKLGNAEQAARAFRSALSFDPDNAYARAALAEIERAQGRAGEAVALLEEALERLRAAGRVHPDRGLLHLRLGQAYADLARRDQAVRELTLARELLRHQALRVEAEEALQALTGPVRESTRMPSQGSQ